MKYDFDVLVIDFGCPAHKIIKRVEELNISCKEINYKNVSMEDVKESDIKGIIFSGSSHNIKDEIHPDIDNSIFKLGIPILGICYGHQLISHKFDGNITKAENPYHGFYSLSITKDNAIFNNVAKIGEEISIRMNNDYLVSEPGKDFIPIAKVEGDNNAFLINSDKNIYSIQCHPEYNNSYNVLFENFFEECGIM